ncbi:hypothetical protein DMZ48_04705 [Robertkochia solimangrovi]|nr:hypothetical protein DMZ48_04705 [Robertkochia solimangrovi]
MVLLKFRKFFENVLGLFLIGCLFSCKTEIKNELPVLKTGFPGVEMPEIWIDADTGHEIRKVTNRQGDNRSFYFHNYPFYFDKIKGDTLMVFYGDTADGRQLFSVNLTNGDTRKITGSPGEIRGEILGKKTHKIYFHKGNKLFSSSVDTGEEKLVYTFPDSTYASVAALNATENLLAGVMALKADHKVLDTMKGGRNFDNIYEAKILRHIFTLDPESGTLRIVYTENAWLNHLQFSPSDPNLLMYCHEGPWHKVDRIWTLDLNSGKSKLMHKRSVYREIAGHEFFSPDGEHIWFDLQIPRGETFYLAGRQLTDSTETRYELKRNEWSIHYAMAPDRQSFAGDGGDSTQVAHAKDGMWLYHFVPDGNSFRSEKLVNMKYHNYDLEPNVHFTPDGKAIIFRANFEGKSQIYEVKLRKTID